MLRANSHGTIDHLEDLECSPRQKQALCYTWNYATCKLDLGGCVNEMAALQTDRYTEVLVGIIPVGNFLVTQLHVHVFLFSPRWRGR